VDLSEGKGREWNREVQKITRTAPSAKLEKASQLRRNATFSKFEPADADVIVVGLVSPAQRRYHLSAQGPPGEAA